MEIFCQYLGGKNCFCPLLKWGLLCKERTCSWWEFCVLQVVSWCFTVVRNFIITSQMVFNLRADRSTWQKSSCSKGNNSKVGKPELWFMCSAGAVYLTSPGHPTDIGLQLGKACYPCSG